MNKGVTLSMRFSYNRLFAPALCAGLMMLSPLASAKNKKVKAVPKEPQDEITVVGHIPLTNGPVVRFLTTQHYSSYYLYAEHAGGKSVTLIDVTKIQAPSVLSDVSYPSSGGSDSLFAVTGTAALVTGVSTAPAAAVDPQIVRIMDFSDPAHPKVAREFTGVTAISRDDRRGLIFVANPEGIWVLLQRLAEDPQIQIDYEHYIMYNR
jgi:hypothetical protein